MDLRLRTIRGIRHSRVALAAVVALAAGLVGIGYATSGEATATTAVHPAPAGGAVPADSQDFGHGDRQGDGCCPSQPPADAPPSFGGISYHTFFQAFTNVPNNTERVVKCGGNYPYILFGWGLVIPTLAGQQVSSHAVYDPDGWAFSARSYFGRTVDFNVFAVCSSQPPG